MSPVGTEPTLEAIVAQAVRLVPARWAAALVADRITSTPATLAATTDEHVTDVVAKVAGIAGTSPGWVAFEQGRTCVVPDLQAETGYGSYGQELVALTPIRSVLSVPLVGGRGVIGVLTTYGDRAHAFGADQVDRAELLADVAAMALTSASNEDMTANLRKALESNRTIGAAVGILVERYRLTEERAFDVLRVGSRDSNHKLVELAQRLVTTGTFANEDGSVDAVLHRRDDA